MIASIKFFALYLFIIILLKNKVINGAKYCYSGKVYANFELYFQCNGSPYTPKSVIVMRCLDQGVFGNRYDQWKIVFPTKESYHFQLTSTDNAASKFFLKTYVYHNCTGKAPSSEEYECTLFRPNDNSLNCNKYGHEQFSVADLHQTSESFKCDNYFV
uniref:ZP domain-containing protein n=1 Tax=Parastrongyloides trichosuri TaxID=131310 RepID=A0A0N4Z5Q1_PARTI